MMPEAVWTKCDSHMREQWHPLKLSDMAYGFDYINLLFIAIGED